MRISDEELEHLIEVWRSNGFDLAEGFAPFLDLQDARKAIRGAIKELTDKPGEHWVSGLQSDGCMGMYSETIDRSKTIYNLRKCVEGK